MFLSLLCVMDLTWVLWCWSNERNVPETCTQMNQSDILILCNMTVYR